MKDYCLSEFKMKFSTWIKRLEKRKIISRFPPPIIPFIMGFIFLILGFVVLSLNQSKILGSVVFYIAGFTFIFAILHLIVVRVLDGWFSSTLGKFI